MSTKIKPPPPTTPLIQLLGQFVQGSTIIHDLETVYDALDSLRLLISEEDYKLCRRRVKVEGWTRIVLNVLKKLTQCGKGYWVVAAEPAVCNCLLVLSILTKENGVEQEVFQEEDGVKFLVRFLTHLGHDVAGARHMRSSLQISVCELIWNGISGRLGSIEQFLTLEGPLRVLDLLEVAGGPGVNLHVLSTVLQLMEFPGVMDQVQGWERGFRDRTKRFNSGPGFPLEEVFRDEVNCKATGNDGIGERSWDTDVTLAALLCELWRDEEIRFGVPRSKSGLISNLDQPLLSSFAKETKDSWEAKRMERNQGSEGSCRVKVTTAESSDLQDEWEDFCTLDLICSIRPKIYLVIRKIIGHSGTEATVFGGLSLPNQVTMQIIVNFLDLKEAEVWLEMLGDLRAQRFRLVESDAVAVMRFVRISRNKVQSVLEAQRYLIHRHDETQGANERELYGLMNQADLQGHLLRVTQMEDEGRTMDLGLLKDKKAWQLTQLEQAVLDDPPPGPPLGAQFLLQPKPTEGQGEEVPQQPQEPIIRLHRTVDPGTNVTIWPGRSRMIRAEPDPEEEARASTRAMILAQRAEEKRRRSGKVRMDPKKSLNEFPDLDLSKIPSKVVPVQGEDEGEDQDAGEVKVEDHGPLRHHHLSHNDDNRGNKTQEEGFYEVDPESLTKALRLLQADEVQARMNGLDEDRYWIRRVQGKIGDYYKLPN